MRFLSKDVHYIGEIVLVLTHPARFIRHYRNKILQKQINKAFATPLSQDELESLEFMRSHQKRLARND